MSRARSLANLANSGVFSADASTSRVGINSSAPEKTLDVVGDGRVSGTLSIGGTINYEDVTSIDSVGVVTAREGVHIVSAGASIYSPANNELALYTNSSEKVRINSSGSVGIGTDDPLRQLEVFSTGHATAAIKGDTQSSLFFVDSDDSNIGQISYIHADNDMYFRVNDEERLRITSAGKVGIGLTDPDTLLHLASTNTGSGPSNAIRLTDNDTAVTANQVCGRIEFETKDTGNPGVNCQIDSIYTGSGGGSALQMRTGFAGSLVDALRIDSDGVLNVPAGIGPQIRFENQHSVTTDAAISTYDDANGVLFSVGSNYFFNSSGAESRYNTSEESCAVVLNRTGDITLKTGGTSATATTRLGITSDGAVNIGGDYTQTAYKTQITGDLLVQKNQAAYQHPQVELYASNTSAYGGAIKFTGNFSGTKYTQATIRPFGGSNTSDGSLAFFTGDGTEKLRIASNGNVGIGTDAYGNVSPLVPLHVCRYTSTDAITDYTTLRNASTLLLQTSNNVNNSKSGILFSGSLHSTDGCNAGIIANHENVAEDSESTSLSFYTSHNESVGERLRITSEGKIESSGPIQIQNGAIFASHSRSYTASTTATGLFGIQMTGGHGFADLTWAFVDTGYPNGVRMGKIFLTFSGSGTNITAVTIASSTESSITNGTLASITWTASVGNVSNVRLNGTASSTSGNGTLYLYGTSPSFTGINPIANA